MKANPSKFKFTIMSSEYIEPQELMISDDVCFQSQTDIKVLGVTIDRLTFNEHIRVCTLKATRQLNALSWVSRYLDTKSKSILYNSFVASNFNHCPLVWYFCGVTNNNKPRKSKNVHCASYLMIANQVSMISTTVIIIRACACWSLFVATLTNTIHYIYHTTHLLYRIGA